MLFGCLICIMLIVDRHQETTLETCQLIREPLETRPLERRLAVVVLTVPIGWVEIKEGAEAVIAPNELSEVQTFNDHASHAVMQVFKHRFER